MKLRMNGLKNSTIYKDRIFLSKKSIIAEIAEPELLKWIPIIYYRKRIMKRCSNLMVW
jgi:hypothetical protein